MHVVRSIAQLRTLRPQLPGPVAFVPTMGALHEGHLSLVRLGRERVGTAGSVTASIFVNPTQFNDPRDLVAYPRTEARDLELLEAEDVDLVFIPEADEVYPPGVPDVMVDVPQLTSMLEGAHRPGHFIGVCRVVLKLFNLVRPDLAVFGQKDFQQLRIIEAMTRGLNLPIEILRGPTLRESDGLAMSSRNVRLSPDARRRATSISRALAAANDAIIKGERSAAALVALMTARLLDGEPASVDVTVDYAAVVDADTLEPLTHLAGPALLAIAAHVGGVRLIDNRVVDSP